MGDNAWVLGCQAFQPIHTTTPRRVQSTNWATLLSLPQARVTALLQELGDDTNAHALVLAAASAYCAPHEAQRYLESAATMLTQASQPN